MPIQQRAKSANLVSVPDRHQAITLVQIQRPILGLITFQPLNAYIAEVDSITMASKTKMSILVLFTWMGPLCHVFGNLAKVRIQNGRPVKLNLDRRTFDSHLLIVPLACRS